MDTNEQNVSDRYPAGVAPPNSFRTGMVAFKVIVAVYLAVAYWINAYAGAAVFVVLMVVGIGVAIWRSRKRHLAYEAMLAADRTKGE